MRYRHAPILAKNFQTNSKHVHNRKICLVKIKKHKRFDYDFDCAPVTHRNNHL